MRHLAYSFYFAVLLFSLLLGGCDFSPKELAKIDPELIVVKDSLNKGGDSIRHYYPVLQGEVLGVVYELENRSDEPFFIQEVQTSCGCLALHDDLPIVVLPHKTNFLHLEFDTSKNSGYVSHYVDCYGNLKGGHSYVELAFDVNIVPPADYVRDYEEVWHDQAGLSGTIRDFVDGKSSQKGYYYEDIKKNILRVNP